MFNLSPGTLGGNVIFPPGTLGGKIGGKLIKVNYIRGSGGGEESYTIPIAS